MQMDQKPQPDFGPPVADVFVPDEGPIYDPAPSRERTRGFLAVGVFLLLVATIGCLLVPVVTGARTWAEMEGAASSLLPAVLGVAATVLAFYFATEQAKK